MADDDRGLPADVLQGIDTELDTRFAPHAGDPLYDELKRVRREELIAIERTRLGLA